jgi:hypothetical protein
VQLGYRSIQLKQSLKLGSVSKRAQIKAPLQTLAWQWSLRMRACAQPPSTHQCRSGAWAAIRIQGHDRDQMILRAEKTGSQQNIAAHEDRGLEQNIEC